MAERAERTGSLGTTSGYGCGSLAAQISVLRAVRSMSRLRLGEYR
jgi:hypothetical protein